MARSKYTSFRDFWCYGLSQLLQRLLHSLYVLSPDKGDKYLEIDPFIDVHMVLINATILHPS